MVSESAASERRENAPIARPREVPPTSAYDFGDRLTELLMKYRWAVVVPVVLPSSKLFAFFWAFSDLVRRLRGVARWIASSGPEGLFG